MNKTIYNDNVKNFFKNSPYDEDGAQKLSDGNLMFKKIKEDPKKVDESSFVPIFSENFFNEKREENCEKKTSKSFVQKRLNDFDGNILRESAVFNFDDNDICLEEKIRIAQRLLQSYKERISIIESYGNSPIKNKLVAQKEDLEGILNNLNNELKNRFNPTKNITSKINYEKRILIGKFEKLRNKYKNKIRPYDFLYKFFPRIYQTKMLRESLKKLRKINSLVNELAQSQTPYGEGDMKYQSIIAYLSSASSLHSKLKKQIGN